MYGSVVSSMFTVMQSPPQSILEDFHHPQKKHCTYSLHSPSPRQPLILFFVSLDLPILDIPYNMRYFVPGSFQLA